MKSNASKGAARILRGALAAVIAAPLMAVPAAAQERTHRRSVEGAQQHSRPALTRHPDRNFSHDSRHAPQARHNGRWHHGQHDGRIGGRRISGGLWHYPAAPVLAYPLRSPQVALRPLLQAAQAYWYYCAYPSGYYPSVPACAVEWQRVAAPPGFLR